MVLAVVKAVEDLLVSESAFFHSYGPVCSPNRRLRFDFARRRKTGGFDTGC